MSIINTSLSAMQAATVQSDTSAHNIANVNTEGFKKLEARLSEGKDGGVVVSIGQSKEESAAPDYQVLGNKAADRSNTNLTTETLNSMSAKRMLDVNIKAAQTTDEMARRVIDILGLLLQGVLKCLL